MHRLTHGVAPTVSDENFRRRTVDVCIAGVDAGRESPQDYHDQLYDLDDPKLIWIRMTRFICTHFPVVTYRTRLIGTHLVRDDLYDPMSCTDM